MAYCNPTNDRRLIKKMCDDISMKRIHLEGSLSPNFEYQLNKDSLKVYKGFVFLPGTNKDNPQHLKLHLPTGHIYSDKNDHCTTFRCPGVFNCLGHNAHPIHSRIEMNLEAFRWQVRLFLLHEGGRVKPKEANEICYQDWPLELGKTPAQLYESLKMSLSIFHKAGKEENGQPTFMKKNFIEEYPQKKLDRLMDALRLDTHYWSPYSSKKSAVSGRDQPKPIGNKLPVMSVSSSDSSLDKKLSTSSPNPRNSFKNGRPWGPLSRRCSLPEERIIDEPVEKIRFAETLLNRSAKIYRQNGMDVFAVPLRKKSIETSSTFQHFVFGIAEGPKEHRTILVLGEDELERKKFIDEILNFIFNVTELKK